MGIYDSSAGDTDFRRKFESKGIKVEPFVKEEQKKTAPGKNYK